MTFQESKTQYLQPQFPPEYQPSELYETTTASYYGGSHQGVSSLDIPNHGSSSLPKVFDKPVVVPQTSNIFFIKTFSPFARAYSPSLGYLTNPISQDEFLTFIHDLNNAFLSPPIFQAMHVIGGGLLGSQILPAQAVGGVFQITSVLGSAGFSIIRVRKYMKKANTTIFAPRGLTVKLMSTKKMMAAINFTATDGKGKLKLPPLDNVSDLDPFIEAVKDKAAAPKEDPRIMRLKALQDYVAPLTFDVPVDEMKRGIVNKYGGAPMRWLNNKQLNKIDKAREKSMKKRGEKEPEVEAEVGKTKSQIHNLEQQIVVAKANHQRASMVSAKVSLAKEQEQDVVLHHHPVESNLESEIKSLENVLLAEQEKRDQAIAEIHRKGDKNLLKVYKKEEKIANRILWIVIQRQEGSQMPSAEDLVRVET